MPNDHPALIRLSNAEQALSHCRDLSDFKKIIDIAEAARVYVRAAKIGEGAARHAEEIKLRAQRKAGEFLGKLEKGKGGRNSAQAEPSSYRRTVQDADLDVNAAKRYQQVAAPAVSLTAYYGHYRSTVKNHEKP